MSVSRRSFLASAAAVGASARGTAMADDAAWPSRVVRIVCPFAPGASHDVLTRLVAEEFRSRLGQAFIVENVTGMGGSIGMAAAARAAPDGYTIGSGTVGTQTINQFLYKSMSYDPERDFEPVSLFWEATNCLFVSAEKNPARTLDEFIAWAKAQPRGVTYGSSGLGTTPHLSGELFRLRTGINAIHVAYRDAGQRLLNLRTGALDFAIDSIPNYGPLIQEGTVRGLAVTSPKRWPATPDVPTMAEAGMANFEVMSWGALVVPARTPPEITAKLSRTVQDIAADPAFQKRYSTIGALAVSSTPEATRSYMARERTMWAGVIKDSGTRIE